MSHLLRLAQYSDKPASLRSRLGARPGASFGAATVRKRFLYGGSRHCIERDSIGFKPLTPAAMIREPHAARLRIPPAKG